MSRKLLSLALIFLGLFAISNVIEIQLLTNTHDRLSAGLFLLGTISGIAGIRILYDEVF